MNASSHRILLLHHGASRHVGTVDSHLTAFEKFSDHKVLSVDSGFADSIAIDFRNFDVIMIHYSVIIIKDSYISINTKENIKNFRGIKILYIQDEYRWVDDTANSIRELGIDVVFSVVDRNTLSKIYHHPWLTDVRFETTLTGFVPEEINTRQVPDYNARTLDVAYRARRLPAWGGAFGQEKWRIGERFLQDAERFGLVCDISNAETDRLYGSAWLDFVSSTKAVLGTGSGSSFIDFTGQVIPAVEAYSARHPDASFEEIRDRFLKGEDGKIVINVISPRCFEAAALRTLMILYPDSYSGILEPWRHYVPLQRDHSNMEEVVATLRDDVRATQIIRYAYEEVACSGKWTYRAMIDQFDHVVREEYKARAPTPLAQLAGDQEKQDEWRLSDEDLDQAMRSRANEMKRYIARQQRNLRVAVWLSKSYSRWARLVSKLPSPVAKPLRFVARRMNALAKPLLRRLLLGS